ncbi:ribose 1,5-bisphosphokinase [Allohahella marinimesophila]|uniref:Ribose 1,5-bisphosphate phosphokinase PhnN n=1 Tax=Allohahella marinimesophila TaxID=1054972 RepID=A0ABP7PN41_9GAMM
MQNQKLRRSGDRISQVPEDDAGRIHRSALTLASSTRLFYLMGASGSGKDSLLRLVRERLNGLPCLTAHRYITRPPELRGENHVWLAPDEFQARKALGAFAMSWEANGYWYGIGQEIDHWLASGSHVLVNGSRAYAEDARKQYGDRLIPLVLDVAPEILKARLLDRGRESIADIERRVARAASMKGSIPPGTILIDNNQDIDTAVRQLLDLISSHSTAMSDRS